MNAKKKIFSATLAFFFASSSWCLPLEDNGDKIIFSAGRTEHYISSKQIRDAITEFTTEQFFTGEKVLLKPDGTCLSKASRLIELGGMRVPEIKIITITCP